MVIQAALVDHFTNFKAPGEEDEEDLDKAGYEEGTAEEKKQTEDEEKSLDSDEELFQQISQHDMLLLDEVKEIVHPIFVHPHSNLVTGYHYRCIDDYCFSTRLSHSPPVHTASKCP